MATATSRLQIAIEAKNSASPALKTVTADLKNMDNAAKGIAGGLAGLGAAAGVGGLVALGGAAVGAAFEMSRLAATASDVEASFESMAGAASDQMFEGLKEASRGAISDMDLMLSANRAMLLGVADSTEEMVALMDVARARSQAMGTTTAEAFGDLVVGLGRASAAILDNLGITLDANTVYQEYADSIGKSVGALTDQEKKQALVNAVLRESADLVRANEAAGDDAASNFERMDAAITNAKVALGELFSPAVVTIATALAEATTDMVAAMQRADETELTLDKSGTWQAAANNIREINQSFADTARASRIAQEGVDGLGAATDTTKYKTDELAATMSVGVTSFNNLGAAGGVAAEGIRKVGEIAPWAAGQLAALKGQADATSAALAGIQSAAIGAMHAAASAAVGILPTSEIARIYGESTKRIQAQQDAMEAAGMTVDEIDFKMQEMAKRASAPFDIAVEGARAAEKALKGTAPAVAKLSEEYTALQSAVEGVLSSALDPGVGVDPDDVLASLGFPREDEVNENARRLADIAKNGLKGQDWLGEFGKEVPDIWRMIRTAQNPQAEAAMLLKDFQDGLLTSPIDKAKVKEIVRRTITGDENMASLAREIATELAAEMGVPLSEALAATQGAMGTGTGAGASAATAFADAASSGLDESGGGGAFIDKFTEQMRSRYSLLSTAGRDAGKMWGESFLAVVGENVPAPLISILVDLVTPGVMSKFYQQGSLTGSAP